MSTGTALSLAVLLLAGNAFFVGAEFAIISARRSAIEPLAEAGSRRARSCCGRWSTSRSCWRARSSASRSARRRSAWSPSRRSPTSSRPRSHALGLPEAAIAPDRLRPRARDRRVPARGARARWCRRTSRSPAPTRAVLWFGPPLVWIARCPAPGDRRSSTDWRTTCCGSSGSSRRTRSPPRSPRRRCSRSSSARGPRGCSTTPRACSRARSSSATAPRAR